MLDRLLHRNACELPTSESPRPRVRLAHFLPLIGFLVPTIVIGYGVVLPRHHIDGMHELSVGFGSTVLGATVTYVVGVMAARRR